MPVVPFVRPTQTRSQTFPGPMPDEEWALMAAAQMHSEGRLVQVADKVDSEINPMPEILDTSKWSRDQIEEFKKSHTFTGSDNELGRRTLPKLENHEGIVDDQILWFRPKKEIPVS